MKQILTHFVDEETEVQDLKKVMKLGQEQKYSWTHVCEIPPKPTRLKIHIPESNKRLVSPSVPF